MVPTHKVIQQVTKKGAMHLLAVTLGLSGSHRCSQRTRITGILSARLCVSVPVTQVPFGWWVLLAVFLMHMIYSKMEMGIPGWLSGLALPSAKCLIQEIRDRVPHLPPCIEPASPSASVSASLCVCVSQE